MVQFLASNTFVINLAKIQMVGSDRSPRRSPSMAEAGRARRELQEISRARLFMKRRIVAHTFSLGASNHAAHQTPRYFPRCYCDATLRATVSSFSRTMLLVSSSGKTIGSSFLPG